MDELTKDLKYYSYYLEAYNAVLGGMVGYYEIQIPQSEAPAFALSDTQIKKAIPEPAEARVKALIPPAIRPRPLNL